jgi:transcriptional regulator with XRE-family HTH domain
MIQKVKTAEKLKRYRRAAGLTQVELAERAGVAQSTIVMIERSQIAEPRPGTLRSLAEALGIEIIDLLDDIEEI